MDIIFSENTCCGETSYLFNVPVQKIIIFVKKSWHEEIKEVKINTET